MIELNDIDTSVAEKNIIKLFKKNETYFLNGIWGSGKTEFLKKLSGELSPFKLVELKLWEIKDERSVIEIAFSRLYRCIYWMIKFGVVLAVVISVLMTPLINLGLSQYFQKFIIFAGIISLIVTVWQFLKYKSDDFYRFLFTKLSIKNKILVVDDFDRITPQKQEDLFRLFNILKGHLPIVFVGDFTKVSQSEGDYLKKIIDKRIELPIVLHPRYIWNEYFNVLSKELDISLSKEFKDVFISEKRNLRDRKQFNDLVNQEFFQNGKLNHVQIEQQLSLIYLYLFYPGKYQLLRDGGMLEYSTEYQNYLNKKDDVKIGWVVEPKKTFDDIFKLLLTLSDGYPSPFTKSRETYLLYETVSNLSAVKAKQLLKDDKQLNNLLLGEEDYFNDFYQFVASSYLSFSNEEKEKLVDLALKLIGDNQSSVLISYIINQKNHEIMPSKTYFGGSSGSMVFGIPKEWDGKTEEEIINFRVNKWEEILIKYKFDFSQQLYFFEKYLRISFHDLGLRFSQLSLDLNEYLNGKRKDFYFLTYLSIKDLWYNLNKWDEQIWSKMDKLSSAEYLSVLSANKIISSGESVFNFDNMPDDKTFSVYIKVGSPDDPYNLIDYTDVIEKYIRPHLNNLSEEGFQFNYIEQKNREI